MNDIELKEIGQVIELLFQAQYAWEPLWEIATENTKTYEKGIAWVKTEPNDKCIEDDGFFGYYIENKNEVLTAIEKLTKLIVDEKRRRLGE